MKTSTMIGAGIGIAGFAVLWYFYDWRLVVGIVLVMLGNNLQRPVR